MPKNAQKNAQSEKLLFGFEREEVERAVHGRVDADTSFSALENGDFLFFRLKPHYHEREMLAIRPMRCVSERATQGKHSCKITEVVDHMLARAPSFRMPRIPVMCLYKGVPHANLRLPEILNTSGWFDRVFPADWSGYDLLRVDVFLENQEVERMLLEVEDDLVEPPVSLTFDGPSLGQWFTLELDLTRAVGERSLNLRKMNNIWVRLALKDAEERARAMHEFAHNQAELEKMRFVAFVDNIRLCMKGVPSTYPVLEGARSGYTSKIPRSYAAEEHFLKDGFMVNRDYLPDVVPASAEMPRGSIPAGNVNPSGQPAVSVIPIADMIGKGCLQDEPENGQIHSNIRLTCTASFDPSRIVVGFDIYGSGALKPGPRSDRVVGNNASAAVCTKDGGATWRGFGGVGYPSVLGGNQSKVPPRQQDLGGDIMALSAFGCLAIRGPHMGYPGDRVFFARSVFAGNDWVMAPNFFVTGEPRHCHWLWFGDVVGTPSGRLWMGWEVTDRKGYEDDSNLSVFAYCSDDGGVTWQSWRGPGFSGSVPSFGSSMTDMWHVRLAPYRGGIAVFGGHHWTWFDGRKWSTLQRNDVIPWQVVSCGDEIFIADETGPVRWYDGSQWLDLVVPGRGGVRGRLSACGDDTVVLVEPDETGRKLLCWRKKAGGEWRGPEELASERTRIIQLAAQRYAPGDSVPVAYMCLSEEDEGKPESQRVITKAVPGNQHYHGTPFRRLYWTFPQGHYVHEPWIKLVRVSS